ncbi:MAG TPA: lysophospholipid acyltransferase family protein [Blastocatellia bacterium]|nr:lysophospholipid acyltransferase family protein [Blastocatellia bacterium]
MSEQSAPLAAERKRRRDVNELRGEVYHMSGLAQYRWRDRLLIRIADRLFYFLIRTIGASLRWEVRGMERLDAIYASHHRAIFTSWHACIFGATWMWRNRGIVVMSSQSRDGEFIGRFIKRLGYGTARGSASRGSFRALTQMSECLASGIDVGFTIDGPRGPAYVAKPGAVTLARHSGQAILPFHVAARRYFALPSWDRLQIPWPFTRALTLIGGPIYVARDASPEEIEAKQQALQATLDELRREGEVWRLGQGNGGERVKG